MAAICTGRSPSRPLGDFTARLDPIGFDFYYLFF
jgi:hypothetical protein